MFHYTKIGGDAMSAGSFVPSKDDNSDTRFYGSVLKRLFDTAVVIVFLPLVGKSLKEFIIVGIMILVSI